MKPFVRWVAPLVLAGALIVAIAACGSPTTPTPGQTSPTPTPIAAGQATPTAGPQATPASSFDAAAYFRGKTIVIIDGFSPGGGSDVLARMFAVVAPRHFPGSPRFIVQNLPGSGGLRGLQETLRANPNDSSKMTLGMVHNRFVKQTLAGEPVDGFDLATTRWVGVPDLGLTYRALYARRAVATTWDDVVSTGRTITVGGTAPGDTQGAGAALVEAVGGPVRFVYGYGGTSEIMAAFDRGELDAIGSGAEATVERLYPEWIPNQYMVPLFWWTVPVPQDYLDKLGAPEPVHVYDTVPMTDEQKAVFEVVEDLNLLSSRTFLLPPGTPDEVYQAVVQAWESTVQDPQFIESKLAGGFEAEYVSASKIREIIEASGRLSPEGLQLFAKLAGVVQ